MFGGIPQSFVDTYHKHFPKTDPVDEYDMRIDLYELYHHLNHTVLFGVRLPVTILLQAQTKTREGMQGVR